MLRGYYTAAAGMISQQQRQEMLTNNMANANTPGYKADQASLRAFPEMLMSRMNDTPTYLPSGKKWGVNTKIGAINTGVYMQEILPHFKQGDIQQTNNQTDLALVETNVPVNEETGMRGTLFFEVQNANGEPRYTRNGGFALDGSGFLTTQNGLYVNDEDGQPIQILGDEFSVSEDGTVLENGQQVARIKIAYAENPGNMVKDGNGLFRFDDANPELPAAFGNGEIQFSLKQGFIERSNVDIQQAMTEMMMAYRTFEANQKVVKAYDESMGKAVNEIGRLR